jgi:DNA primase
VIEAAQPLMEFKLEQTMGRLALDTPEAKGRAVRAVAEVLGWHPDPVARHEYAFMVARHIGVDPEAVHRALSERRPGREREAAAGGERNRRLPGHVKVEREALLLLLTRTQEAAPFADGIGESDFTSASRRELFKEAHSALESGSKRVDAAVTGRLSPDALSLFTELTVAAASLEDDENQSDGLEDVFVRLRVFRLAREIKELRATLQEVNPLVDPKRHDALFTDLVALEAERRDLLRQLEGVA